LLNFVVWFCVKIIHRWFNDVLWSNPIYWSVFNYLNGTFNYLFWMLNWSVLLISSVIALVLVQWQMHACWKIVNILFDRVDRIFKEINNSILEGSLVITLSLKKLPLVLSRLTALTGLLVILLLTILYYEIWFYIYCFMFSLISLFFW